MPFIIPVEGNLEDYEKALDRHNSKTNFEQVKQFHTVFDCLRNGEPTLPSNDEIATRLRLILEETLELFHEFGLTLQNTKIVEDHTTKWATRDFDIHKIAKENADLLYVTYGQDVEMGIPIDNVFNSVHNSNLSKLTATGEVLRREDGKVLKSDQYQAPDITKVF